LIISDGNQHAKQIIILRFGEKSLIIVVVNDFGGNPNTKEKKDAGRKSKMV
jgi:hypothetical protein